MRQRFGGPAVIAALCAALALALWVAIWGPGHGLDYETGTYTFVEPATDYVDEDEVLVQDGVVTDMWITEADRANQNYGYTPNTPAAPFVYADETAEITTADDSVSECWFVGTDDEHCTVYADITPLSPGKASGMSAWDGLEDGEYTFTTRSVTWENWSRHAVEVKDGVVQNAPSPDLNLPAIDTTEWGEPGSGWVLYWVAGADEPFAACYDDLPTFDEEWCIEWNAS